MRNLIVFLAMCTFTAAMIPRDRRAVDSEEEERLRSELTTTETQTKQNKTEICAQTTPCSWSVYGPYRKKVQISIVNSYCVCAANTTCKYAEDDGAGVYVYRCRSPTPEDSEHVAAAD